MWVATFSTPLPTGASIFARNPWYSSAPPSPVALSQPWFFQNARGNHAYRSPKPPPNEAVSGSAFATRLNSPAAQADKVWNNLKCAAVSLAATRLKQYIDSFLPGFDEHYQRGRRELVRVQILVRSHR